MHGDDSSVPLSMSRTGPRPTEESPLLLCGSPESVFAFSDSFGLAIVYKHTDVVEVVLLN